MRILEITRLSAQSHVLLHGAASENDLLVHFAGEIENLAHSSDVRREHRNDREAFGRGEELLELLIDDALAHRVLVPLDVRRIGHEQQHAFFAGFSEGMQIDHSPEKRRRIHLEIAGVDDFSGGRVDDQRRRIDDAVIDGDRLDFEILELDRLAHFERADVDRRVETVLFQALSNEEAT